MSIKLEFKISSHPNLCIKIISYIWHYFDTLNIKRSKENCVQLRQHIRIHTHKTLKLHQNNLFRCCCVAFSNPFKIPCHKINVHKQMLYATPFFLLNFVLLVQMILKCHFILFRKQLYTLHTNMQCMYILQTISMWHLQIVNLYFKSIDNHNGPRGKSVPELLFF